MRLAVAILALVLTSAFGKPKIYLIEVGETIKEGGKYYQGEYVVLALIA